MKQEPKRIGRPPIEGKRYLILLEDPDAEKARMLGGGNITAGIRLAIRTAPNKPPAVPRPSKSSKAR
jgi:hypothetical protein